LFRKGEAPSLSGLGDGHVNLSEMKGLWLRARMTFGNSQVWDRFMLKVFINDLLELQRQGWNLPSNLNIPYMQCLANGDSSSCTQ